MTDRELMQQALDALDIFYDEYGWGEKQQKAHEALRARLAQPEQKHSEQWWRHEVSNAWAEGYEKGRLQREWQGLTNEEIDWLWGLAFKAKLENMPRHFARMVEEKLKEKNT